MGKYFTAGEFAAIHGMSKQTLLFYDKIGLIKPAYVDENNRYRYYSAKQMEQRFAVGMPRKRYFFGKACSFGRPRKRTRKRHVAR